MNVKCLCHDAVKVFLAFLSNNLSFSFQVNTPRSLVTYAVKEVAKVYRFYDQDAFSFVRNIDYHPLTITDSAPPEIAITDLRLCLCCINRQEQKRILMSARCFLKKRRHAINAIFDTIAKMIVNFHSKEEVDELDLKKLRVKTINYRRIMDFLESVGVEVKVENMLEKMIGHIQQFRFRAKLLNLAVNQSYLGHGENVEDMESARESQGEGMKREDTNDEHNKNSGVEKVARGFIANASDHQGGVNEERAEKKTEKTGLIVGDNPVEFTEDGVRKVGGGIIADAAFHQKEAYEEKIENFIEVINVTDGCYVKFAGYCPGDRLKIEEGTYNYNRNNGIERVGGYVKADTDGLQEKIKEERTLGGIEKSDLAMEEIVESAGNGVISKGGRSLDDHQEKVNKGRIEDEIENSDLAVGDDIESVSDGAIRVVEGSIAVGHGMESAGDSLGDGVKIENIQVSNNRERNLSEIKITMVEKEKDEMAVENKGYLSGDGLKIGDMLGDCDRVDQEQLLLGSTTDNEGQSNKETQSIEKKKADTTTMNERFNIEDEEEDQFVLYGMIRCS